MTKALRRTSALAIATLLPLLVTSVAKAQAEVVVASDNFNRAGETPLTVGGNWQRFTLGGVANLAGNQVAGSTGDALYYWQGSGVFDNARQFSRARVTNAGGQVGLVLLGTADQALVAAWGGGTLYIYSYAGGVYQGNLTTAASTLQNGDFIEAVLDAGVITVKINGLVVATVANSTALTSGRPGFEFFQAGATLDDWAAGVPAGPNQGECDGVPDGTPCGESGNPCTGEGKCEGGECVDGDPVVCTPSDLCHGAGVCDPTTGVCSNPPLDCDDGNACTADSCELDKGCVNKPIPSSCDDGNPCTADTCNPSGGCTHTGIDGPDNSCGAVTNSSLCPLPLGLCGGSSTSTFRLLHIQDPTYSTILGGTVLNDYRLNASNPGQFFYNVFHAGTPGSDVDLTIEVPFPFATQGGHPIQVHGSVDVVDGCYDPGSSLQGFTITTDGGQLSNGGFPVIRLSDYATPNLGSTTNVHVSGTVPSTGLVYVTIHLDYDLKRTTGWQQGPDGKTAQGPDTNLDGTLDGLGGGPIVIAHPQPYGFGFGGGGATHDSTASSCNKFNKNPGIVGNMTAAADSDPVPGVRVQLIGPRGTIVGSTTSDANGFYMFSYKHKGKVADYTIKLPDLGREKTVTLRPGGWARVDFEGL